MAYRQRILALWTTCGLIGAIGALIVVVRQHSDFLIKVNKRLTEHGDALVQLRRENGVTCAGCGVTVQAGWALKITHRPTSTLRIFSENGELRHACTR